MNKNSPDSVSLPIIIGVAGGSGSGKTTFAKALLESLGEDRADLLFQDNYYIDQSARFDKDGGAVNFDHPESLDFALMAKHLKELQQGLSVLVPTYDFATHKRCLETIRLRPKSFIIVDGILIFSQAKLLDLFYYRVFIECEESLRFERRLARDVKERGRDPEGVRAQFFKQVAPMHNEFVEPSKRHATHLVCEQDFDQQLKAMLSLLEQF